MRTIPILIVLLVLLLIGGRCDIDHAVLHDRTPSPETSAVESLPS